MQDDARRQPVGTNGIRRRLSAGKEPPGEEPPREEPEADLGRRGFFRVFSRDAIQTAATVIGAASAVRRDTTAAASELLALGLDPAASAERFAGAQGMAEVAYRSPYRLGVGVVLILEQRRLPAAAIDIECRNGGEVAATMRNLAARGGPLLGARRHPQEVLSCPQRRF